jgi:ribose/xylose/arabinose/galactoside ABC-type transport system permease subunit
VNRSAVSGAAVFLVRNRLAVILLGTILYGALTLPSFLAPATAAGSLDRASTMGIVAIGMTLLMIAGQIDLSVGAGLALCGVVTIGLQPAVGPALAALIGVVAGVAVGALNAFLVVGLRINSLVATLATSLAVRSVAHLITASQPISGTYPDFGATVVSAVLGDFTLRTALFVVGILILHGFLTRTVPGRNLFAVGGNPSSAEASGLRVNLYLAGSFIFAGLCVGAAGAIQSLAVNTGSPVAGDTLVVAVIAAVVIGGTKIEGGHGSALGTLGGVVALAALVTVMEYQSIPAYIQEVVTGTILIVLIMLDRLVLDRRPRRVLGPRT